MKGVDSTTGKRIEKGAAEIECFDQKKTRKKGKKRKEREKVMRSYMKGKKYRENKGESAIMEKMKKYIKFARGKIFFSFYEEKTETSRKFCRDVSA